MVIKVLNKNLWTKLVIVLLLLILSFNLSLLRTGYAAPLSTSELNALNEWSQWVPASCNSSGSGSNINNLTPGLGSPTGLTFPNLDPTTMANAINAWILQANPNSEMKGLGATIVADGQHSNVNPFLIVSIARKESSLADPSDYNVSHGNNSFGRSASSGQPSFQGAMLWYRWSSVSASVDYTAPENQNIPGGGDYATYMRDEFGSTLDSNNLAELMTFYAPPGANNTALYISQLQQWIGQIVALANGTAPSTSATTTPTASSNCNSGAVNCNSSTSSNLSAVRQQVVCIAQQELASWKSQPGYKQTGSNSFNYSATGYLNYSQNVHEEWCADFVSWVYNQAGYPLTPDPNWRISAVIGLVSVAELNQNFHWHPQVSGYTPRPGDIAIHLYGTSYSNSHANIVTSVTGNTVTLIGGDQGSINFSSANGGTVVSQYTDNGFYGGSDSIIAYISPD